MTLSRKIRLALYDPAVAMQRLGLSTDSSGHGSRFVEWIDHRYVRKNGLEGFFEELGTTKGETYKLFASGHKIADSLRLFREIKNNKFKTVVEFGSGLSTLSMAKAMQSNAIDGMIYSVESDERWADVVRANAARSGLEKYINISVSKPELIEMDGRPVASFPVLPDVSPNLLYLDGPDPAHVGGDINGITMKGLRYIVLCDPLRYEWSMYGGSKIIIDGRLHNALFLRTKFNRRWRMQRNPIKNTSTFTLLR